MTNEELVTLIQAGERDRIPELWAQVERFVRWKARKMGEIAQRRGVALDDLMQAGFIAVMAAVDYFDPDSGYTFTTYLGNTLKKEFADATGYRTKRAREDPFWDAVPLDTPVNDDDPEGATISDFIVDSEVEQAFPDSEQGQLREALETEIARLTEKQQVVIRLRYWYGFELGQIAHIMGKSLKEVDKLDKMAMRELRRNHKALKPFFASEWEYRMKREQAFLKRIEQQAKARRARSEMLRVCWKG